MQWEIFKDAVERRKCRFSSFVFVAVKRPLTLIVASEHKRQMEIA